MAQPPAGSSLLFGALADSGRTKQRKNGSTRMVLKGVDEIDWFTDRPNRFAGEWSPKKLLKEWDVLFGDGAGAPNAQATFEMGSKRQLVTFEMFKPKLSDSNQTLSFKVRGIGLSNKDDLTGLADKRLSNVSLFIDNGSIRECNDATRDLNIFYGQDWFAEFGPNSSSFADAQGSDYAFVSLYKNERSSTFTPSQKYKMVQSSLEYIADRATSDGNEAVALKDNYARMKSDELSNLLLSGRIAFHDAFTGLLTMEGEMNPWTQASYTDYSNIANRASINNCFN